MRVRFASPWTKMIREVKPPPIMYSGKLSFNHEGVVQPMILSHGFLMSVVPEVLVLCDHGRTWPSHRSTMTSIMDVSSIFKKVPSSLTSIERQDIGRKSSKPLASVIFMCSMEVERESASFCQVMDGGPKWMPSTFSKRRTPVREVVDFVTIPGG